MPVRLKPKSFGPVFVVYDGGKALRYAWSDLSEVTAYPPTQTPVDTLLASLGACIVKSVQLAADQRRVPLNPFTVRVVANKAPDLPGRVERMDITILGDVTDDADAAQAIVKQAKSICTVSNTLNCEVTISVDRDAAG